MVIFDIKIRWGIMMGWSIPGVIVSAILGIAVYCIIASIFPRITLSAITVLASFIVFSGMGVVMSDKKQ